VFVGFAEFKVSLGLESGAHYKGLGVAECEGGQLLTFVAAGAAAAL
jgi:hypothetical protein